MVAVAGHFFYQALAQYRFFQGQANIFSRLRSSCRLTSSADRLSGSGRGSDLSENSPKKPPVAGQCLVATGQLVKLGKVFDSLLLVYGQGFKVGQRFTGCQGHQGLFSLLNLQA